MCVCLLLCVCVSVCVCVCVSVRVCVCVCVYTCSPCHLICYIGEEAFTTAAARGHVLGTQEPLLHILACASILPAPHSAVLVWQLDIGKLLGVRAWHPRSCAHIVPGAV